MSASALRRPVFRRHEQGIPVFYRRVQGRILFCKHKCQCFADISLVRINGSIVQITGCFLQHADISLVCGCDSDIINRAEEVSGSSGRRQHGALCRNNMFPLLNYILRRRFSGQLSRCRCGVDQPDKLRSGQRRRITPYPGQQLKKDGTEPVQPLNIRRIGRKLRKPFRKMIPDVFMSGLHFSVSVHNFPQICLYTKTVL